MTTNQRIGFSLFHFPFAIFLLTLAAGPGCSSQNARLTVRPATDESKIYAQAFPTAYVARSDEGEFEAILIDDEIGKQAEPRPGQPLKASSGTPVTQVVHIRVFWRPLPGTRADHPSATNAAFDWYVLGAGSDRTKNLLHYSGAGFVTIGETGNGAKFRIRNANLILKEQRGDMTDPIGPARLTGTITAVKNAAEVKNQVAQLEQALAGDPTNAQVSITNSPPARSHEGP